jgi:hypothetical protein
MMKDDRLLFLIILVILLGMAIIVPIVATSLMPAPDLGSLETKMATNIFATLTAAAPTVTSGLIGASTPPPTPSSREKDELIDYTTVLRDLVRQNAALSGEFERWYSKVKSQNPTSSDIGQYGGLLARRSVIVNNSQALPPYAGTAENREQWITAIRRRYDAELLYFRLLTENDPQARRNLYDQFASTAQDADQIYSQAASKLISTLESASIDCAQVKMCATDFSQ